MNWGYAAVIFFFQCSPTSRGCTCSLTVTQSGSVSSGHVPKMLMRICPCGFKFASVPLPAFIDANRLAGLMAVLCRLRANLDCVRPIRTCRREDILVCMRIKIGALASSMYTSSPSWCRLLGRLKSVRHRYTVSDSFFKKFQFLSPFLMRSHFSPFRCSALDLFVVSVYSFLLLSVHHAHTQGIEQHPVNTLIKYSLSQPFIDMSPPPPTVF